MKAIMRPTETVPEGCDVNFSWDCPECKKENYAQLAGPKDKFPTHLQCGICGYIYVISSSGYFFIKEEGKYSLKELLNA